MTPIYAYVFYMIFKQRDLVIKDDTLIIIGLTLATFFGISTLFFKKQIVNFVLFRIFLMRRPIRQSEKFELRTYF